MTHLPGSAHQSYRHYGKNGQQGIKNGKDAALLLDPEFMIQSAYEEVAGINRTDLGIVRLTHSLTLSYGRREKGWKSQSFIDAHA